MTLKEWLDLTDGVILTVDSQRRAEAVCISSMPESEYWNDCGICPIMR